MLKTVIVAYAATAVAFLVGDGVWLGFVARDFYRGQLGSLMLPQPNLAAAVAFYLVYVAGVVYLAVLPAVAVGSWTAALVAGLALGLTAYATYDLSNLATLKGWPLAMTFVDMAWGMALTGVAAVTGYAVTRAVGG